MISVTSQTMKSVLDKNSNKHNKKRISNFLLKVILCGIVVNSIFSFLLTNEVRKIDSVIEKDEMDTNIDSSHSTNQSIEKEESQLEKPKITSITSSPYAYVWIIGGIHEEKPSYKGFLYDVLVSAQILRKSGSTADFWLQIRLSPDSKLDALPTEDLRLLGALGFQIKQHEKPNHESFSQLMFDKFFILSMIDYKRVMYLDADTMPLINLDYLFHLSDPDHTASPTLLKSNFIYATRGEPCNGGLFFVQPSARKYEQYIETIKVQREKAKSLPYPHFDRIDGWGHNFRKNKDKWEGVHQTGFRWNFHGAHVDQGLLYYLTKYLYKDVSIAIGDKIQNWKAKDGQDNPQLEVEIDGVLAKHSPKPLIYTVEYCSKDVRPKHSHDLWKCMPPYTSFAHFFGATKPWQNSFNIKDTKIQPPKAKNLWFRELIELNENLEIGLDFLNWDKHLNYMKESSLGYMPFYKDQANLINETTDMSKPLTSSSNLVDKSPRTTPLVVAYAVSLVKCGDHQNHVAGLIDAALVLLHSIHKISSRNSLSGSKYDYKMYAIVHSKAQVCADVLKKVGFEIIIVDPPVETKEIKGKFLRENIHKERCCGHDEFIKLYAYTLPEEIIVHTDLDFTFFKPMDHLFDAIHFSKDSPEGKVARNIIELERPGEELPDKIGAFLTRDWTQVARGKWPPGFQAGFLVARRDPSVMDDLVKIIKEGNYSEGWGNTYGWGNKGYGGYVGAMAMQGLIAYYYDHFRTNSAVELNQCLYNHVGVDVKSRGKCRNGLDTCEDCRKTNLDKIYSTHYTTCRKPWLCQATGASGGKKKGGVMASAINTDTVILEHCLQIVREWHLLRSDLESSIYELTNDDSMKLGVAGDYRKDIFQGHCDGDGSKNYLQLSLQDENMYRIQELYV